MESASSTTSPRFPEFKADGRLLNQVLSDVVSSVVLRPSASTVINPGPITDDVGPVQKDNRAMVQ